MLEELKRGTKGITLIALIVTIIVLMILAGVSINLLVGENGIIKQATTAKDKNKRASLGEEIKLVMQEVTMLKLQNKEYDLKEKLEKGIPTAIISNPSEELTDVYYVSKDGIDFTIYVDGTIVEGKVGIWNGGTKCPEIVSENGNFEWYITNAEELNFLRYFVNDGNVITANTSSYIAEKSYTATYVQNSMTDSTVVYLMNDLDLRGRADTNGEWSETENNRRYEWTPIGTTEALKLKATFLGNNHTIKGVYVNSTAKFCGIFGNTHTIKDLTVKDSYIKSTQQCVGGIVGAVRTGTLQNCHNINTEATGLYSVGGVVGQASQTMSTSESINNCTNTGKIISLGVGSSGYSFTGGVIGNASNYKSGIIENCINNGKIEERGNGGQGGGIVGCVGQFTTVRNCNNYGVVTSQGKRVGGIVGAANSYSTVTGCTNSGAVEGQGDQVGGIVGILGAGDGNATLENCTNSGAVEGQGNMVGGIAGGAISNSTVTGCTNSGAVEGQGGGVGGIVGIAYISSTVTGCTNSGAVTATGTGSVDIGGIVGSCQNGQVIGCINRGEVSAPNSTRGDEAAVGGIVGYLSQSNGKVEECENYAKISAPKSFGVGGIVGTQGSGSGGVKNTTVDKCYNEGEVEGKGLVGGITGEYWETPHTTTNCYNKGKITSSEVTKGAIVGNKTSNVTTKNCYYLEAEGIKAVQGQDDEDNNVKSTSKECNSLKEFIEALEKNEL